MKLLRIALAIVVVFGSGTLAGAQSGQRTVLVELFTSEGCSSCPPADALLRKLDGMRTADGVTIIALGEHVTYWNSLGWTDRFSSDTFTERQQAYGERFRLDSVYTPQVVVNGQAQVVGSDESALLRAVGAVKGSAVGLELGKATVAGNRVQVAYTLRGTVPAGAQLWAALTDDHATTEVKRGENGGRRLEHAAVARSLSRVGAAAPGEAMVSLPLPQMAPGEQPAARHVVVFVQESNTGKVLAVESLALQARALTARSE